MWRELYSEKMVVAEERRLRVDDSPMGKYQVNAAENCRATRQASHHSTTGSE